MRSSFLLAGPIALASGCFGGASGSNAPPRMVAVPDVVRPASVAADEAAAALHRAGLRIAIRGPFSISSYSDQPLVVSQFPAPGTRVPAGTAVRLAAELERGTVICPIRRRVASDVVGETLAQAERALGVAFSAVIPPLPPSRVTRWEDAYRVSSQSIAPGSSIAPCATVRLQVVLA
jgi:beta-lactam-binding protein with PASTA domain